MSFPNPSTLFDASYFQHGCGTPYGRTPEWRAVFREIANRIVRGIDPSSVLDAGCAMGILVEELRDVNVDAFGVDISHYAIDQIPMAIKPHCWVGSLADPLPRRYDLIVCIEVLEHLPQETLDSAIENLCRASDDLLISSSPDDYEEATHFNVQPPAYWASRFAEHDFLHDVEFDASFITPWAMRFRKRREPLHRVIEPYERKLWLLAKEITTLRELALANRTVNADKEQALAQLAEQQQVVLQLRDQLAEKDRRLQGLAEETEENQRPTPVPSVQVSETDRTVTDPEQSTSAWRPPVVAAQGTSWVCDQPSATSIDQQIAPNFNSYQSWASRCESSRYQPERVAGAMEKLSYRPVISIVMPVHSTAPDLLRKAIDSVRDQYYPDWELCICDDASPDPKVRNLLEQYAAEDARIHLDVADNNSGIAIASNRALALARGEFVGLLDHDDELTPDALYQVVTALQEYEADLIYSDEDKLDELGRRCDAFFKPAWSPDLLLSTMYTCHFSVYRRSILERIGGFREGFEGSQDHDLALRFTEQTDNILHLPMILYHWRKAPGSAAATVAAKPGAHTAGVHALKDAMARRGIKGSVENTNICGYYRVKRDIVDWGLVSIVIRTQDHLSSLRKCVRSIESKTYYRDYEILIVDHGSQDAAVLDYFEKSPHTAIRVGETDDVAKVTNAAVRTASGEYVLLLDDDTEVIAPSWLTAMVEQAQRQEVGAVGGKLLYPDGRVQHAGMVLGLDGVAGYSQRYVDGSTGTGYFNFPNIVMNYSALSGTCLLVRRSRYLEVGGLDEDHGLTSFADVDLCLRLKSHGYLNVYTPHAVLHHQAASEANPPVRQEQIYMMETWNTSIRHDSLYNPNLNLQGDGFIPNYEKPDSLMVADSHHTCDVVEPLTPDRVVGQHFIAGEDYLCAIGIKFATNGETIDGTVRFCLYRVGEDSDPLVTTDEDAGAIVDGEYHIFEFEPINGSGEVEFLLSIEFFSSLSGAELSVWRSSETDEAHGPYLDNGEPREGTLSFYSFVPARPIPAPV